MTLLSKHQNQHHSLSITKLTITILIEQGESLLELSNLLFRKLISHCVLLFCFVDSGFVGGSSLLLSVAMMLKSGIFWRTATV